MSIAEPSLRWITTPMASVAWYKLYRLISLGVPCGHRSATSSSRWFLRTLSIRCESTPLPMNPPEGPSATNPIRGRCFPQLAPGATCCQSRRLDTGDAQIPRHVASRDSPGATTGASYGELHRVFQSGFSTTLRTLSLGRSQCEYPSADPGDPSVAVQAGERQGAERGAQFRRCPNVKMSITLPIWVIGISP